MTTKTMITKEKAAGVSAPNGQEQSSNDYLHNTISTPKCQGLFPLHGEVEGKVWRKKVRMSRHMLLKPVAWAVDLTDLERAEAQGVRFVEIHETEHGVIYKVSASTLRAKGIVIDRGFGVQLALTLENWSTFEERKEKKPLPVASGGAHE